MWPGGRGYLVGSQRSVGVVEEPSTGRTRGSRLSPVTFLLFNETLSSQEGDFFTSFCKFSRFICKFFVFVYCNHCSLHHSASLSTCISLFVSLSRFQSHNQHCSLIWAIFLSSPPSISFVSQSLPVSNQHGLNLRHSATHPIIFHSHRKCFVVYAGIYYDVWKYTDEMTRLKQRDVRGLRLRAVGVRKQGSMRPS